MGSPEDNDTEEVSHYMVELRKSSTRRFHHDGTLAAERVRVGIVDFVSCSAAA